MNKKTYFIIGGVFLFVLFFFAYRANQIVQPTSEVNWEDVIAERNLLQEPFFVENDNVKLEAEILTASNGSSEKPAVIFIPGSGSTTYQAYAPGLIEKFIFDIFIPRDYAVV
ncbi:MAG: hypothetical protein R6U02_06560, partial [Alkalibacterium sp.]|uniref:hypothetical protein n=1 Tax=Alkalibacterium sp. TaxID=1872447 RepID=UPI003970A85E